MRNRTPRATGVRGAVCSKKRPIYAAKATYQCSERGVLGIKRDLLMQQKRPVDAAKETCRRSERSVSGIKRALSGIKSWSRGRDTCV